MGLSLQQRKARLTIFIKASFIFIALSAGARGQITFCSTDWPTTNGSYYRTYVASDVSAPFPGVATNTAQRWDFSQPQQGGEFIRTRDIVPITDGGHGASFPNAGYAERFTDDTFLIWDYYRVTPSANRTYYGFYNDGLLGASPTLVPALDVPDAVSFGSNWTSSYTLEGDFLVTQQSVSATVDAFGTLVLPQLGEVPALRVNQLTYQQTFLGSFPFGTAYFREYYWLVKGLGKALHIVSASGPAPPPVNFATASSVRRVFAANTLPPPLHSVSDLRLNVQTNTVVLHWRTETNATGYRVESVPDLNLTNWQLLAEPATNTWTGLSTATQAQRFFRVFLTP